MQICATVDRVCEFELFFKGQRWINVLSVYPDSNISQSGDVQVNHVEFLGLAQSCNVATFCAIIETKIFTVVRKVMITNLTISLVFATFWE